MKGNGMIFVWLFVPSNKTTIACIMWTYHFVKMHDVLFLKLLLKHRDASWCLGDRNVAIWWVQRLFLQFLSRQQRWFVHQNWSHRYTKPCVCDSLLTHDIDLGKPTCCLIYCMLVDCCLSFLCGELQLLLSSSCHLTSVKRIQKSGDKNINHGLTAIIFL